MIRNSAPTHDTGVVTSAADDRVDVLVFTRSGPQEIARVAHLPGMELKRGYRVVLSAFQYDCCITAVIGFWSDEQIAGTCALAGGTP